MEEIRFKPSLKPNKYMLFIGIILMFTIIGIPIGFPMIVGAIISLITKQFYVFKIRENEIEIGRASCRERV